jgi:hypothetical protein
VRVARFARFVAAVAIIAAAPASAAESASGALLRELKQGLDRIRAATPGERMDPRSAPSVKALVAVSRARVLAAMGEPSLCWDPKKLGRVACSAAPDWRYSFYKLRPDAAGGGLELVLSFERDRVRQARWIVTA